MLANGHGKKGIVVLMGLILTVGAVGCRGRVNQVQGTVSYAGKPLPGGSILLLASDGKPYHGQIDDNGRFCIPGVPTGEARVCVSSMLEAAPRATQSWPRMAGRVQQPTTVSSRIPDRYADLSRSGLTVKVEKGSTLELELQ